MPRTFEKQSAEISLKNFDDSIENISEDYPQSVIRKVIRYNGAKNSDGGNLNIFNDSIKTDEKFKVIENF